MRRKFGKIFILILIWGVTGFQVPAGHGNGKIPPGLAQRIAAAHNGDLVPIIIQTHGDPETSVGALVRTMGGSHGRSFDSVRGLPARVPAGRIAALARNPRVRNVSLDWTVASLADAAAPYNGAPSVWTGYGVNGAGVTVAVIDSGLNEANDLTGSGSSRTILHVDMLTGSASYDPAANDGFGHGTHVAGIVGGSGQGTSRSDAIRDFRGVAPGADLISLRALGPDGSGATSDVLRAIDWVIANRDAQGIRVLNLSLGHPIEESYLTDPLCQALESAWQAGIVVVVSAGNFGEYGYSSILSPANDPYVITVGAAADWGTLSHDDDSVASFSSMGPTSIDGIVKPDLVASGVQIVSMRASGSFIDVQYPSTRVPFSAYLSAGSADASSYAAFSGTSMAAPVVSGAAALMLAVDPSLNPDTVKARLMASAVPIDEEAVREGAGVLDIPAALARTDVNMTPMSARSPRIVSTTDLLGVETVDVVDDAGLYVSSVDGAVTGQIAIWGQTATWGQIAIWGGRAEGQIAIWGAKAQTDGDSILANW